MVTLQVSKETSGQNSVVILFQALICSLTPFFRNHFSKSRKNEESKIGLLKFKDLESWEWHATSVKWPNASGSACVESLLFLDSLLRIE